LAKPTTRLETGTAIRGNTEYMNAESPKKRTALEIGNGKHAVKRIIGKTSATGFPMTVAIVGFTRRRRTTRRCSTELMKAGEFD